MPAMAKARYVRVSPLKARRLVNLIRGRALQEAQAILDLTATPTAQAIAKVVNSAAANAENNHDMDPDFLWLREAYVDQGPSMRRVRPASQGRVSIIRRPTSHITVIMDENEELKQAAAARGTRRRRRKESGTRRAAAPKGRPASDAAAPEAAAPPEE